MLLLYKRLRANFSRCDNVAKDRDARPFSIDYRKRDPTQYTSRMETVRVEKETDTRIMQESSKKSGRKGRGHEVKKFQTRPNIRRGPNY